MTPSIARHPTNPTDPTGLPPGMPMGLEAHARYTPNSPFTWSNSCHACICEVDAVTGAVKILRFVVSDRKPDPLSCADFDGRCGLAGAAGIGCGHEPQAIKRLPRGTIARRAVGWRP